MAKNIILFDLAAVHAELLPLSYTRPVAHFVVGADRIIDKWQAFLPGDYSYSTEEYLSELFPARTADVNLLIAGNVIPTKDLADAVGALEPGGVLYAATARDTRILVAACGDSEMLRAVMSGEELQGDFYPEKVKAVEHIYDVFMLNGDQIETDFERLTEGREGQPIHLSNTVIGSPEQIFIESGAVVEGVVLNSSYGPIYIGRDVQVMEGSCLRGPIALMEHSTVNMGTKIYPGTTLGPHCKVGGELNNVVIFGYSNKAHDGFLGNAVLGEWCNLGAGCVASNLKNDYTQIKLWNYPAHRFLRTGLQFCGLIMGDHSKAGINTMFNTATVAGVGVNIHGSGFPRNFIASFQEGGAAGFSDMPMEKFFDIASRMMARRGKALSDADIRMFRSIRAQSENYK